MWTIVCFIDENCVEVVPTFWFKNGLCAWPKKNVKKHITRRINPNEEDFNYYKARILSKNIENLQVARSKLVRAEDTSELSCYDADKSTRRKRHQTQVSDNESEYDYEKKNFNYKTKKKSNLKNGAPIQSNLSEPPMFWNIDVDNSDEEMIEDDSDSEKNKNNVPCSTQQPLNSTRNHNYEDTFENIKLNFNSDLISPSGKWKVTSINNDEVDKSSRRKIDFNHTPPTGTNELKQIPNSSTSLKECLSGIDPSTSHHTDNRTDPLFVNLSQSTLLSSPLNSPNTTSSLKYRTDQNNIKVKKQESNQIGHLIDTVHQLIRTTSNLRFEIRELARKIDTMDQKVTDHLTNTSSEVIGNNDFSDESSCDLPLTTIEDLELFEEKLSDKLFRKKVINELSRYEKSTVADTTRQITSKLFHNSLLAQFSYQGQKHKRVFSILNSCSVIFSTVRSIRKFNLCPDIDITKPLKIYMANAKAREENRQKKIISHSNN